jgi:hypothetical protein
MKDVYEMLDGVPIWQHLANGGVLHDVELRGWVFGRLAEMIGKSWLKEAMSSKCDGNLIKELFPNLEVLSIKSVSNKSRRCHVDGDVIVEVDYKQGLAYGKKIVCFEIKHGKIAIHQNQIRHYCEMIDNPSNFVKKADEIRIFFLLFESIDTKSMYAHFHLCELNKTLVSHILNSKPINSNESKEV